MFGSNRFSLSIFRKAYREGKESGISYSGDPGQIRAEISKTESSLNRDGHVLKGPHFSDRSWYYGKLDGLRERLKQLGQAAKTASTTKT